MSTSPAPNKIRAFWILLAFFATALVCWFAPLFHIVPLKVARQQTIDAAFSAAAYVEKLWSERLLKSSARATDAASLVAAIKKSPKSARDQYGRTLGLSSTYYYYAAGTGRIVTVGSNSVSLALGEVGTIPEIVLETGKIFGNAIRDATGLVNVNDFPNSRDFNDISSEINRRVEERVLPSLRTKAIIGATIRFAGCAEIADEDTDLHPLRLVPLVAELR